MPTLALSVKFDAKLALVELEKIVDAFKKHPENTEEWRVEKVDEGCSACNHGARFTVVLGRGEDEEQIPFESEDEERTQLICDFMNLALHEALNRLGDALAKAIDVTTPSDAASNADAEETQG